MQAATHPAIVRQLTESDLSHVIELQDSVTKPLPVGFIRRKTEPEILAYLDETLGVAYGVFQGDELLAMSLLLLPSNNHPNKELRFRLIPESNWTLHACFLENTMVLPRARGRGYQRILINVRLSRAESAGMKWICAGVHVQNRVSWANLLAKGFAIADIRFDRGYPVIGLLKAVDPLILKYDSQDQRSVNALDHASHKDALDAGYIGVRLDYGNVVIYQRLYKVSPQNASESRA